MTGTNAIHEAFPEPVVFVLRGQLVDTKLDVFGAVFHVHSIILKGGSAYFRKFLDSPDKAPAPETAAFPYEYVAVVDDDRKTWGLESASNVSPF